MCNNSEGEGFRALEQEHPAVLRRRQHLSVQEITMHESSGAYYPPTIHFAALMPLFQNDYSQAVPKSVQAVLAVAQSGYTSNSTYGLCA